MVSRSALCPGVGVRDEQADRAHGGKSRRPEVVVIRQGDMHRHLSGPGRRVESGIGCLRSQKNFNDYNEAAAIVWRKLRFCGQQSGLNSCSAKQKRPRDFAGAFRISELIDAIG